MARVWFRLFARGGRTAEHALEFGYLSCMCSQGPSSWQCLVCGVKMVVCCDKAVVASGHLIVACAGQSFTSSIDA